MHFPLIDYSTARTLCHPRGENLEERKTSLTTLSTSLITLRRTEDRGQETPTREIQKDRKSATIVGDEGAFFFDNPAYYTPG
jgi:hypothetical protein